MTNNQTQLTEKELNTISGGLDEEFNKIINDYPLNSFSLKNGVALVKPVPATLIPVRF